MYNYLSYLYFIILFSTELTFTLYLLHVELTPFVLNDQWPESSLEPFPLIKLIQNAQNVHVLVIFKHSDAFEPYAKNSHLAQVF